VVEGAGGEIAPMRAIEPANDAVARASRTRASAIGSGSRRKRRGTVKRQETLQNFSALPPAQKERLRSRRHSVSQRLADFKRRMTVTQTASALDAAERRARDGYDPHLDAELAKARVARSRRKLHLAVAKMASLRALVPIRHADESDTW